MFNNENYSASSRFQIISGIGDEQKEQLQEEFYNKYSTWSVSKLEDRKEALVYLPGTEENDLELEVIAELINQNGSIDAAEYMSEDEFGGEPLERRAEAYINSNANALYY